MPVNFTRGLQPASSPPRRGLPDLSSVVPDPGCAGVVGQPPGGPLSRTRSKKEQRKEIDGRWHRDQSCVVRVPLRALRFVPKNLEFAEDTYIQETMSSHAYLVEKERKENCPFILSAFPAFTK